MVQIHRPVFALALAAALSLVTSSPIQQSVKLTPDIRADTNRDGVVDVTGTSDVAAKNVWSPTRGAIFLPNIGDALGRCKDVDALGNPLTNLELSLCNDASGDTAISPEYFAPLRTMPQTPVSDKAYGYVATYPEEHASHIRVFWKPDDNAE